MATKFLGLRTIGYKIPNADLDKAKAWYSNVLGIAPYFDEPFYVGFNVAGYELGLMPEEDAIATAANTVTYWGVGDVPATFKELLAKGATTLEEPAEVGGGIVVASVTDPWGNAFGIIYNPHFSLA